MPCTPSLPSSGQRSRGKILLRSISSARGEMWSAAKSRTLSRNMSAVSPRPKSKPRMSFTRICNVSHRRARSWAARSFDYTSLIAHAILRGDQPFPSLNRAAGIPPQFLCIGTSETSSKGASGQSCSKRWKPLRMRLRLRTGFGRDHVREQVKRGHRERMHVAETIAAPGFEGDRALVRSGNSDAAVTGGIAVSITGRPRCSALRHRPCRREALPCGLRQEPRVGLGRGAYSEGRYVREVQQRTPRDLGIHNGATEEVGGGARQRQQRRSNQAAGRGFRHGDRLAALLEKASDLVGTRNQFLHRRPSLSFIQATGPMRELARPVAPRL